LDVSQDSLDPIRTDASESSERDRDRPKESISAARVQEIAATYDVPIEAVEAVISDLQ
jgi:hypothetical protein